MGARLFSAAAAAKSLQSCLTLCDPRDGSPPGYPSLGFSRQEHWSGLPFPSPMHEMKSESEVTQSCPTPRDPMDCSLPGSSIHGICQARVLELDAIAFSRLVSSMWNLPRPGISSVFPTLASGFLTTEPPGMSFSPPLLKKNATDLITKPG